ncbi:hypothetical protein [Actinomycetospora sp. TBRC 11914]|uniref:hypothetical protein n=1 Tax=Actinomycetospora sp. TBRC 11914 TaxID=2729387 RepID=UPI00145D10CA|nr:hypothetical protein [Actinomycetospora sp. TBRC 11914]NMO93216.1 hypothetical protein [Actinomycetospora sp. TBRC 11914]
MKASSYDPRAEILWSATDDWVSLSEAAWIVRDEQPVDPVAWKRETLALLADLLREKLMIVGDVSEEFRPWQLSDDDAVKEIDRRWEEPFEDISPFHGVWFANTPAGEVLAEQLADAGMTSRPEG